MGKIVFDKRKEKITIVNKLMYPESVNERVYNAIISGGYEGFLPVCMRQKRKEISLECVIQGYITLNEYFGDIVTKKMFLDFVHEIVVQIRNCEKSMINSNNLDLQKDRIFIDPYSKTVKCIYWPVVNNQSANPVDIFLKQLPYEIFFDPNENCDYIEVYKAFFDDRKPFSINNFERMVLELQGKKVMNGHSAPSGVLSELSKENEAINKNQRLVNASIEYDPFAGIDFTVYSKVDNKKEGSSKYYCESCGVEVAIQANFCVNCGTRITKRIIGDNSFVNDSTSNFGPIILGDESAGTTVLGYSNAVEAYFPTILREKTNEKFLVNKPNYRIGKKRAVCDLCITDNTYISRNHADIISKENRYYIVDRKSTNKTYINGKVIPAEVEIEIFSGTKIRLGNENFIFSV